MTVAATTEKENSAPVTTTDAPTTDSAAAAGAASDAQGRTLPVLAVDLVTSPELLGSLAELARGLEDAGVGALTLSDGGLHPIHVASHLAPLTRSVGLLPRTDAIYVEPFHLATQLMSLDHISHGRAGWLLLAETDPAVPPTVGRELLSLEQTAREAADVLAAARLVWDSWADDAVVRDTEKGLYFDASRLQYADARAETFSVRGPAITPRSPQGLLPVLVADTDREAVGEAATAAADGRVLDVDLAAGADAVRSALETALSGAEDGQAGEGQPALRLVRLTGLDLDADPLGTVQALAADLRAAGLIAPVPSAGIDLRTQLGLAPAPHVADPARRSDRARLTSKESA